MKLVSINVSQPVTVTFQGEEVSTGIFKKPMQGSVAVHKNNLAGDGQADLAVHGGVDKAVYAYSLDHYAYWQQALRRDSMPYGQFGENLTISGLSEAECFIGDHWQIGTAVFAITQPRQPCFKLGVRFNDTDMPKRFTQSGLTGVYLKVLQEGIITAGDEIKILKRGPGSVNVNELFRAFMGPALPGSQDIYKRALQIAELSDSWRQKIATRMHR
ncbi:MAG TPA: MOSC domain-containing protein [Steroidobacteraceae bacterium]|nr:MOSC domain-containing protein [Steroidobacteraceae bacterium]